jgi:hypothetical protein
VGTFDEQDWGTYVITNNATTPGHRAFTPTMSDRKARRRRVRDPPDITRYAEAFERLGKAAGGPELGKLLD